jgi:hypothetical protein
MVSTIVGLEGSPVVITRQQSGLFHFKLRSKKSGSESEKYSSEEKKKVMVTQPLCISKYNKSMGGVDRADQNIAQYRIGFRSNKWWWALFAWVPDVAMQNAWLLYRKYKPSDCPNLDLLAFRREVVQTYFKKYCKEQRTSRIFSRARVPQEIRFDKVGHFEIRSPTTRRCALCGKSCRKMCQKCGKGLHGPCFNKYHGVEQ